MKYIAEVDVETKKEVCVTFEYYDAKGNHCLIRKLAHPLKETLENYIKMQKQQPCEDAISREAVINYICEGKECYKEDCKGKLYKRCLDLQWVYNMPSVTPQPKVGKWIDVDALDSALWHECSECGETEFYLTNYCPNCGAKMEVEE